MSEERCENKVSISAMKSTDSKAAVMAEEMNSIKEKAGALYWDSRNVLEGKDPTTSGSNVCSFYDRRKRELRMPLREFPAPQNQPHRSMFPRYTEAHATVAQEDHAPS